MHSSINADQLLRELALSIARNSVGAQRPIHEVIAGEGLTQTEFDAISTNPQYQRYVDAYTKELRESGFSVQAKAKLLLEDLLPTMYHLAKDVDAPAAARVKIFENFAELADAKPKNTVQNTAGPGFTITFNIPGTQQNQPQTIVLEAENVEKTPEIAQKLQISAPKQPILLSEGDDYEYAGDDVL
jgi:hypothetical protein